MHETNQQDTRDESMPFWIVMPDEVEAKTAEWLDAYPELVRIETEAQYVGKKVCAITITDSRVDNAGKKKQFVHAPHAHEPGATAGCMDFVNALLTGEHLDGRPFELDRERVLKEILITVAPDANPDGRSRSPVRYWDGRKYTNEEFWCWMRGKDRGTGKMWKRLDHWSTEVELDHPEPVGIVYEQISEHEYVEPNRTHLSSLMKLVKRHRERYHYDQFVAVHQTEFPNSPHDCMVILPCLQDELSPQRQGKNRSLAEAIIAAWRAVGANPIPQAKPLGYAQEQREYFVRTWGDLYHKTSMVTTEVQNNNPRTRPKEQMVYCETGVRSSVGYLIGA